MFVCFAKHPQITETPKSRTKNKDLFFTYKMKWDPIFDCKVILILILIHPDSISTMVMVMGRAQLKMAAGINNVSVMGRAQLKMAAGINNVSVKQAQLKMAVAGKNNVSVLESRWGNKQHFRKMWPDLEEESKNREIRRSEMWVQNGDVDNGILCLQLSPAISTLEIGPRKSIRMLFGIHVLLHLLHDLGQQSVFENDNVSQAVQSAEGAHFGIQNENVSASPVSSGRSKLQQNVVVYSESSKSKGNVTVTARIRPLSRRKIQQGEEIAWRADGETIVRNAFTPSITYAYDRVFGPTTTTHHVYDIAAHHVVGGAMEGVNGTIIAYGVTSSGKTHTMHGDQRSPGIIPLAVEDAFSIIQETPSRQFLLRVSYLEIYNEVINDLLNPAGKNLKIMGDSQGAFVQGLKKEVVSSPGEALSLIAAGEERRHVASTNFNSLSSRSHTIFTLTIESSPCGEYGDSGDVNLSQLNLMDLAGSESSKAKTTGVRRKEGSFINKSLLTLGTVISKLTEARPAHAKLTEARPAHIPYRDSKLTRLLQSSLSGHGRVSLICTVTPSSRNTEETHNTLKFADRAKHIKIQAAQNKIIDEKSMIKKYQTENRLLKAELEHLKSGIVVVPQFKDTGGDDIFLLKQKSELEAQLNEKSLELEVKAGDNRVLQEQLNQKINECETLQETINSLKRQLSDARSQFDAENDAQITLLRQTQGAGLANLGNSCFLNAVMRCFTHSVLLLQGLYSIKHQTPCDCSNERFCLICALKEHVEHSLTASGKVVFPRKLVDNLNYFSSSFRRGQQEDAHEFLQSFLNGLESALPSESDNLVKQVFGGSVISKLRCCNCNHISDTYEPSVDLSLEIDAATSLVTALESFTNVEHIEEFTCDQCKEKVSVDKQLMLDQIPPVCAFHLKRFKNDGSKVEKIDKHLDFPQELDLKPFTSDGQTDKVALKYELHAVVVHMALTSSSGHYYCYIRSAPHKWHKFDDDKVTSVAEACVLQEQAYILFYAKEGTPSFSSFMETYKPSLPKLSKTSPQSVMENVELYI